MSRSAKSVRHRIAPWRICAVVAVVLGVPIGCAPRGGVQSAPPRAPDRAESVARSAAIAEPSPRYESVIDVDRLRTNAARGFGQAVLCKPAGGLPASGAHIFAPLILRTSGEDDIPVVSPRGVRTVKAAPATAIIHGVEYRQWVFAWSAASDAATCVWLRVTLNSSGAPVIWETCAAGDSVIGVYVARSLEEAAMKQFGQPASGRQFAVERSAAWPIRSLGMPSVAGRPVAGLPVVLRIVDDGPQPMGPMVYVDNDGRIASVACRCMPSQVDDITATVEYRLASEDDFTAMHHCPDGLPTDPAWLETALRIPDAW